MSLKQEVLKFVTENPSNREGEIRWLAPKQTDENSWGHVVSADNRFIASFNTMLPEKNMAWKMAALALGIPLHKNKLGSLGKILSKWLTKPK
jgi:hypothetical protein